MSVTLLNSPLLQLKRKEPAIEAQTPQAVGVHHFLWQLDDDVRQVHRRLVDGVVGTVQPQEIIQLVTLIGRVKARYIAKVLEAGRSPTPLRSQQVAEVRDLRDQLKELEDGLAYIRQAAERGDLQVEGVLVS